MCVMAFLSAWILANLSEASSADRLWVSLAAALSCLGASLFHYGANTQVYSRKEERIDIDDPRPLIFWGIIALLASVLTEALTANVVCAILAITNAIILWFYAANLSKHWLTKNVVIAWVCATPALSGWLVGTYSHPASKYLLAMVFISFLAREIIKDVCDIKANHGIRVTLPMVIGITGALLIAALGAVGGAIASFMASPYFSTAPVAGMILLFVAARLVITGEPGKTQNGITLGMAVMMLSFL